MKTKKPFNPFYVLLLIVGTVFAITAFAYGVMTLRLGQGGPVAATTQGAALIEFLARHGTGLLIGELIVLAVLTVGAIGTDEYWSRRTDQKSQSDQSSRSPDAMPASKENS